MNQLPKDRDRREQALLKLHKDTRHNMDEIRANLTTQYRCGYCLAGVTAIDILNFTEDDDAGICPYCGIDVMLKSS